ncbi:MAG: S9 family peptidase [Bacteroidales bacterium]|nr:S9 family peptidase [Bacteroidales bacterium]
MNRKTINILLSVFLISIQFVVLAQGDNKVITLEDIYKNRKFASKGFQGVHPMNNGDHYCQLKKDSLNIYEYATGKLAGTVVTSKQLIPDGDTVAIPMSGFKFSDDETKIMFPTDEEAIYRRSSKASYYIYDLKSKKLVPLSKNGKQRLATFSPEGTKVAFVRDNNLYINNLPFFSPNFGGEQAIWETDEEYQITADGKVNEVINGATDWVYEEEFEFSQAFAWSPDGKRIAFYRFDERKVKEYELTYYGDLYPEQYKYKYPKAGEDNSVIGIYIYDLDSKKTIPVDFGAEADIYIPRIKWTEDANTLALYRMNRHQNKLELLLADAVSGKSRVIYTEENKYYIEINDHWHFMKNKKEFLISSEKDGYRHMYLYDISGKALRQLTTGTYDVLDVLGVDEKNGLVYYSSAEPSPMDKDIRAVSLDGKKKIRLNAKPGGNSAQFNSTFTYYIGRWSDINTPAYIAVYKSNGTEVRMLQDNAKLRETIKESRFSNAEFFRFRTGEGTELNGFMVKPPDFDPSRKYPVLFTIYGGPGSQTVNNSWGAVSSWNQLWAQNGIIVVSVDNRGTGGRGEEFKKCTYLQLGKYETLDQIEAAKYLGTLGYVDKTRIGMWGWSFGGYLTLSCLTKGADYFSFGVAVAPVTNWKYYDNIYTERFMRTPKENNEGYEENSPVNHAGKLTGKLLMICGMADDNVHPQNSYDMVTALVGADKQFESQFYPNSNHGIYTGKNTSYHLYKRMTNFILTNF